MKNLYLENTANYPRMKTDKFFADYSNLFNFKGIFDNTIKYIENAQLLKPELWDNFVNQFREDADYDNGWRGEYWGKMMRGACFVYSYTRNPQLYEILRVTVCDMLDSQDNSGRISSYSVNHEFEGWDMWSRKYVLLGMQYFMEICADEDLNKKIVESMKKQADYILSKIGYSNEGRTPITKTSDIWRGLNSSSILEPIIRLYSITGEEKYFEFASYIVDEGGTDIVNIFDLAYEDNFYPYQYPVTKAYEMISCFEGLVEYYRHTKNEKYKIAAVNFADKILESDFTIIGSCGCTHELFDHSTVRQANTTNEKIAQETCVTVTLMKYFYQLTLLTGDVKYADAFETSFYNGYLGTVNTSEAIGTIIGNDCPQAIHEPLPFDSYSPLTSGIRGGGIGGFKLMSNNHYYGCCACIGSVGIGLVPKMALLSTKEGFVYNLYFNGTMKSTSPLGRNVEFVTDTAYPKTGYISVIIHLEKEEMFEISFRNPAWSKNTSLRINGEDQKTNAGYILLNRLWKNGDVVELFFDMSIRAEYPISYTSQILMNNPVWDSNYVIPSYDVEDPLAKKHIALIRGPIVLAQDNRIGYSVDDPIDVCVNKDGTVDGIVPEDDTVEYEHMVEVHIPLSDGTTLAVTDCASAGKTWTEESKMAVWMLTK